MPLFSSTLCDCIEKKKDFTEGGARYRDDRNEIFAVVNVVNGLLAIKELCFDTKKYTLKTDKNTSFRKTIQNSDKLVLELKNTTRHYKLKRSTLFDNTDV